MLKHLEDRVRDRAHNVDGKSASDDGGLTFYVGCVLCVCALCVSIDNHRILTCQCTLSDMRVGPSCAPVVSWSEGGCSRRGELGSISQIRFYFRGEIEFAKVDGTRSSEFLLPHALALSAEHSEVCGPPKGESEDQHALTRWPPRLTFCQKSQCRVHPHLGCAVYYLIASRSHF